MLEHPAYSQAWDRYGLSEPLFREGWTLGLDGGASCYVEQGRYGLPVKKATWLYAYGVELPELRWGFTADTAGEPGHRERSKHRPDAWRAQFGGRSEQWTKGQHHGVTATTPPEFRDALIAMTRSAPIGSLPATESTASPTRR